jgi:hypothetical protein
MAEQTSVDRSIGYTEPGRAEESVDFDPSQCNCQNDCPDFPHCICILIHDEHRCVRGAWEQWRIELEDIQDVGDGRVLVRFTEQARGRGSGASTSVRVEGVWTVSNGRATSFRGQGR